MIVLLTEDMRETLINICAQHLNTSVLPEVILNKADPVWRSIDKADYADKTSYEHQPIKYKLTQQGAIVGYRELAKKLTAELEKNVH